MYLILNWLFINIMIVCLGWLIDFSKGYLDFKIWYQWCTNGNILYITSLFLVLVPPVYFKIANNVSRVEIEETNQTLKIYYTTFFFKKHVVTFKIYDDFFEYRYLIVKRSSSFLYRLSILTRNTSISFYCEKKMVLTIRDSSGWTSQQLEDIIKQLSMVKKASHSEIV